MSELDFKFLEEKPLETIEQLSNSKFGHKEIASTLAKVVKNCPAPFTIGLFAKWGSGKSTIANSLKKDLPKEKIPVIIFDVWKHEGDALRRTFLKEMVAQLKQLGKDFIDMDFNLNERIEQSISRNSESTLKFREGVIQQFRWYIIGILAFLGIGGYLADYFGKFDLFMLLLTSVTGFTGGGALLVWLVKNSVNLFSKETVTYGVDRFEDPHQFEEEFGKILKALKNERVLVIFDNLDRVIHNKVVEVLSTIKTFLEPKDIEEKKKEVIFLIPCDATAIKEHLKSVYIPQGATSSVFDPDEFLRKFFNSIIWIPDFIPSELESFASKTLKDTKVATLDNSYVAWIITKAFRNNPRQIIQFVNILLANYLLVKERQGKNGDFPEGFLEENIPQLTKYLIMSQLFPDETEYLRDTRVIDLKDIDFEKNDTPVHKMGPGFSKFIKETESIPIKNLRIFFTLRKSEQEKQFSGFDSFVQFLEDRKTEDAQKYFDQLGDFKDSMLANNFSQAIKTKLEAKANPVSSINLIHTLFEVILTQGISLTDTAYDEINNVLKGGCIDNLHSIPPELLNSSLFSKGDVYRKSIIEQWIKVLQDFVIGPNKFKTDENFLKGTFSIFSNNPNYLSTEQANKVNDILISNIPHNIDVAEVIAANKDSRDKFISIEYLKGFIANIPNEGTISDVSRRINVLNQLEEYLFKKIDKDSIVEKFTQILTYQNLNSAADLLEKSGLIQKIKDFIKIKSSLFSEAKDVAKENFVSSLISGFNGVPDNDKKSMFIPIFLETKKYVLQPKAQEIENYINIFLSNTTPDALNSFIAELDKQDADSFFNDSTNVAIYNSAEKRAVDDDPFRKTMWEKLSDDRKKALLSNLCGSNIDKGVIFMESLGSDENKNIFAIFDKVFNQFDSYTPTQKQAILKFVNSRKAGNDTKTRDLLAKKIETCLTNSDVSLQQIGLDAFNNADHIAKPLKRVIIKEVFDWLRKPEILPKYQEATIKTILSGIEHLNDEEIKEFTHFLFDEIVRKSTNAHHIEDTLKIIQSMDPKPKYEERKENFEDIKTRIDSESDAQIKKSLIVGLLGLMPSRTNEKNKDFWQSIEDLKPTD